MSIPDHLSPVSNADLIGHEKAERFLAEAFNAERLHHSWLISGPRGVGKATLAYRFAKYVLANFKSDVDLYSNTLELIEKPNSLYVPREHPVFQRVAAGGHADLLVIERSENKQGNLSSVIIADDVRNARNFFRMTAGEGGWRIIILDSVDEMNVYASNALLKMLEEPPQRALLLLISHNPGRLLPTIRSRCQTLRLEPLKASCLVNWLLARAPDEPIKELEIVSFLAEGSIGRALELIELGGVSIYTDIMTLLESAPNIDTSSLHALASKLASKKGIDNFKLTGELIRWILARIIKFSARYDGQELSVEEQALFEKIVGGSSLDRWLNVWENVDDILASADSANLDRKQVLLNTFSFISQASAAP